MTTHKNLQGTMKPNDEQHDSLGWLAFRYVAGELSGGELTAFEARLDTEQAAREAVACEVELAQAVAIVAGSMAPRAGVAIARTERPQQSPVGRSLSYRARGLLVMAAAASVLIGMLVTQGLRPANTRNNTRDNTAKVTPESAAQQLAGYWQAGTLVEAAPPAAENDPLELATHDAAEETPSYEESVPTWLLAALEPEVPADAPREN